jgi:hypothetical protein
MHAKIVPGKDLVGASSGFGWAGRNPNSANQERYQQDQPKAK